VVTAASGVTKVDNHIRYDFDDAELARFTVNRAHPFSAEPLHPGKQRPRGGTGRARRPRPANPLTCQGEVLRLRPFSLSGSLRPQEEL
jgi:hypothetical protein